MFRDVSLKYITLTLCNDWLGNIYIFRGSGIYMVTYSQWAYSAKMTSFLRHVPAGFIAKSIVCGYSLTSTYNLSLD